MTKPKKDWVKEEVKRLGITITPLGKDRPDEGNLLRVPTSAMDHTGSKIGTNFEVDCYHPNLDDDEAWETFCPNEDSFLPSDINKIIVGLLALKDALREAGYNVDEEE